MANTGDFIRSVNNMLDVVDQAVETMDFSHLSEDMKSAAKPVTDILRSGVNWNDEEFVRRNTQNAARRKRYTSSSEAEGTGTRSYNGGHMSGRGNAFYGNYTRGGRREGYDPDSYVRSQNAQMRRQALAEAEAENAYFAPAGGRISGLLLTIIGAMGTVGFGLLAAIGAIAAALGADFPAIVFMLFMAMAAGGFGYVLAKGRRRIKKVKNFSSYRNLLARNKYANVKDLARVVGQSEEKTVKELSQLTGEGAFKQGHFDEKQAIFMASDDLYSQYLASEQTTRELRRKEREEQQKNADLGEVRQVLDKGNVFIRQIREANDAIADEEVTAKLNEMEKIVTRIFDEVETNASLADRLSMFMDYYLPTTMKLLTAYRRLDAQEVQGENIRNAKREIEDSLDTINEAFEKLLDSFFEATAMDVATDISVMRSMMRQEGLTEDAFSALRRKQDFSDIAADPTLKEKEEAYLKPEGRSGRAKEPEAPLKPDPVNLTHMTYAADPEIEPESDPEMEDEEGGIKLVFGSDIE